MRPRSPLPRSIASSNNAVSPPGNCSRLSRTRSSKPNSAIRSGKPICCSVPGSVARMAEECRSFCTPRSMTPAGSSRMLSFMSARDWMPVWIVCATPWRPAVSPFVCISTMPRSIARRKLARIGASLGTLVIHSRPYQPEGRGKIERFFRTAREQFLANLDPQHPLSLDELNDRLWIWIENVYHRSEHSALGTTPLLRWQRDIEQVRQLPPSTDLRRLFFHRLDRLVRRDSTFLLHKRLYEAPPHLAGHTVEVRFDPLDAAQVEIWFQGQLETSARPVDPVVNGQLPSVKRAASAELEPTGINFVELLKQKQEKE